MRLPAHIEVSGLIRAVNAAGGFATVLAKGEKDAGTILLLTVARDQTTKLYERMPQLDGSRPFSLSREENPENKQEFAEYLMKRRRQDRDTWLVELDIADAERFIETAGTLS
ncbi:MAG: DUF1491 family protein [Alteripontixanthobacter sp.]